MHAYGFEIHMKWVATKETDLRAGNMWKWGMKFLN